jgi:GABA permease
MAAIIPIWGYMLIVTLALMAVNFMHVKNYGEFEFWFALIKVVAIVAFIVIGAWRLCTFGRLAMSAVWSI